MPPILNMQAAIKRFAIPGGVIVLRRTTTNVGGKYSENAPTQLVIQASVQQATYQDLMLLSEGERVRDWIEVIALNIAPLYANGTNQGQQAIGQAPLQVANVAAGIPTDKIQWNSRVYDLMKLEDWTLNGGYLRGLCARVGQ